MDNALILIVFTFGLAGTLALLRQVLIKPTNRTNSKAYKYQKKTYITSAVEIKFYKTLQEITKDLFYIFPQVHLSSLVNHEIPGQDWKGALSHIQRKSVDYVFCDKESMETLLILELDDSTHNQAKRIIRDQEVERIFREASIPLLRIPNSKIQNREFLRNELRKYLVD